MLGLSFEKLIIVALIAVFIIGPERLPLYAGRLAALVQTLRGHSEAAKVRVKEELGDGFDVAEWKQLDPRQYDPRRIIREALAEADPPARVAPKEADATPAAAPGAVDGEQQPESSIARLMRTSRTRLAEAEAQAQVQEAGTPAQATMAPVDPRAGRDDRPLTAGAKAD